MKFTDGMTVDDGTRPPILLQDGSVFIPIEPNRTQVTLGHVDRATGGASRETLVMVTTRVRRVWSLQLLYGCLLRLAK